MTSSLPPNSASALSPNIEKRWRLEARSKELIVEGRLCWPE